MNSRMLWTKFIAVVCVWVTLAAAAVSAQQPRDARAYAKRGQDWSAKRDYDKALADFTEAIRLEPGSPEYYVDRGWVWHTTGKYDKAVADYNKAVQLDASYASAFLYRGLAWTGLNELEKALDDFDRAQKLDPTNAMVYWARGVVWQRRGDFDTAIAAYGRAIQLDPQDANTYADRAATWEAKRQYDKALADFEQAVRLDPRGAAAWNGRAWIEATCPVAKYRDAKRAVEHANKACQLSEWKNTDALDTLAAAYAESGDFANAIKWQSKACDLAPAHDKADKADLRSRLGLYQAHKPYRDAGK
jgi:tetratricopeptide (TPR) repeat protein